MDALNAFPEVIRQQAQIYYWPLDKRERNASGKPGKLHAKVAIIDEQVVLSSANLTDDAFTRNLELGALLSSGEIRQRLREHFDGLCVNGTLRRVGTPRRGPTRAERKVGTSPRRRPNRGAPAGADETKTRVHQNQNEAPERGGG